MTMRSVLLVLPFLFVPLFFVVAQSNDEDPPDIRNVQIASSTDTSVTITWETDEDADSLVNYGLQEDYGIVRIPREDNEDRTEHAITLDGLEPGRTYYFRVVSADEEGNQGISADYRVVTSGTPQTGSGEGSGAGLGQGVSDDGDGGRFQTDIPPETIEEVKEIIQNITNPQQIREIQEELIEAVAGITEDLTIVGPPTVIPETRSAVIQWTTDRPASSEVFFSPTRRFDGNNYQFSQVSTGAITQNHEVEIIGLEPFTEYSFKVRSQDEFSIVGESENFEFTTKALLPNIRNLRIVKVEENAATLAWDTTVPAKALIEYQDLTTGAQNSVGRPTLATQHQMRLADLTLGTRYVAFVIAENSGGDRVRSQPITFITQRDTAAPIITNVTNESTLFPGGESRIQTIVEWRTDEPAYCLMTYTEGVAAGVEPTTIEKEEIDYTERHVQVIVDFAPATVYQFWLNCEDEAGNSVRSEDFVLFTPIQEKNIIDLIIENFESTFGWVQNIGG